jgi:hypothetical protein
MIFPPFFSFVAGFIFGEWGVHLIFYYYLWQCGGAIHVFLLGKWGEISTTCTMQKINHVYGPYSLLLLGGEEEDV